MFAAVTDHVFIDGGHTIDFTNKAFEALGYVGADAAADGAPDARAPDRRGHRARRRPASGAIPHDLAGAGRRGRRSARLDARGRRRAQRAARSTDVGHGSAWALLDDDPDAVVDALLDACARGATAEQLGRALAFAAALRIVRFHIQNDHGDWDTVHHAFTAANALHQALRAAPDARAAPRRSCTARCACYLDRFLNVPAARLPDGRRPATSPTSRVLGRSRAASTEAGAIAYGLPRGGGDPARSSPPSASAAARGLPGSTGTRWSRPACASTRRGRPGRRRASLVPRRLRAVPRRAHPDPA